MGLVRKLRLLFLLLRLISSIRLFIPFELLECFNIFIIFVSGSFVPTRTKIEKIFHKSGEISPDFDEIHEMSILIGGTEDQRLHHDVARQIAVWYKEKPSVDNIEHEPPLNGWEVDRLQYNKAMESKYSPSSILLALNQNDEFLLGIQKDQVFLSP